MATGAATCHLAIILIDARHGVLTQTRRHSFIVSLLGIKHVVVAINKMDLVDYAEDVFERIKRDYTGFAAKLGHPRRPLHPHLGPQRRQRGGQERGHALVPGPAAPELPRDRAHRLRPQPGRPALPGAVRPPPQPRLPRLRRHHRLRRAPQGRRGHGPAVGPEEPGQVHRHLRRRAGRGLRPHGGDGHPGGRDRRLAAATCSCTPATLPTCRPWSRPWSSGWRRSRSRRGAATGSSRPRGRSPARSPSCATASTSTPWRSARPPSSR